MGERGSPSESASRSPPAEPGMEAAFLKGQKHQPQPFSGRVQERPTVSHLTSQASSFPVFSVLGWWLPLLSCCCQASSLTWLLWTSPAPNSDSDYSLLTNTNHAFPSLRRLLDHLYPRLTTVACETYMYHGSL